MERFPSMTRERLNLISSDWFSHVSYELNWADEYCRPNATVLAAHSHPDRCISLYTTRCPLQPSAPAYWSRRQAEVRAMFRESGDPDLMLTFTFVNKWEVSAAEQSLRQLLNFPLDIRFCRLETLMIWRGRFHHAKAGNFEQLIKDLSFGTVKHFVWRLEFRGAPHVHALIWLTDRIPLSHLEKIMFGTKPVSMCRHNCPNWSMAQWCTPVQFSGASVGIPMMHLPKIVGYVHGNDGKARTLIQRSGWGITEYLVPGHAKKSFLMSLQKFEKDHGKNFTSS